ncbi:MAG TPA: lysophospholipid acyltransferase family protein [Chloroflexota bacterium]
MGSSKAPREIQTRKQPRRRKTIADEQNRVWFAIGAFLVGVLFRFWIRRYRVIGAEQVPTSGGVFLICNHTSGMDPFLLGYPFRRYMPSGPGKIELFRNPVIAFLMRKLGIFPLRQDRADTAAVKAMIELYRSGRIVLVYPEGGRSPTGEMREFMPDFARLVIRLKATVVPAAIAGAREVLPIGAKIPRPNTPVVVAYGRPLDLTSFWERPMTPDVASEAAGLLRDNVTTLLTVAEDERRRMMRG